MRALRDPAAELIQIEGFVPGFEVALEGVLERGRLHVLALFDKPDALDGPFFEETLYVTPTPRGDAVTMRVIAAVTQAARAAGLWHGPVHAECRVRDDAVVGPRSGGPADWRAVRARAPLRGRGRRGPLSLEGLLLRAAIGERAVRLAAPSGCGRRADGADCAAAGCCARCAASRPRAQVPHVTGVVVSAKPGQRARRPA